MAGQRVVIRCLDSVDPRDSCPLKRGGDRCGINRFECRYGLTEIVVPEHCPAQSHIHITVEPADD